MHAILWPDGYLPGFSDNFASNEVIAAGLNSADIWPFLVEPTRWPTYYANSAHIRLPDGAGPELRDGMRFAFETFGFPVEAEVVEYAPPAGDAPGRIA